MRKVKNKGKLNYNPILTHSPYSDLLQQVRYYRKRSRSGTIGGEHAKELTKAIARFYIFHGQSVLDAFCRDYGTKLIFPASTVKVAKNDMIGKKALLYSDLSLCVLPCILGDALVMRNLQFFVDFNIALGPLIESGKILPFPVFETRVHDDRANKEYMAMRNALEERRLETYSTKSSSIPVFGSNSALLRQIDEDLPDESNKCSPLGTSRLFLPCLEGVSLGTMQKVIQDHEDPTVRFRLRLREMLKSELGLRPDYRLLMALEEIDVEVRNLNTQFIRLAKDTAFRKVEVALGTIALGVTLLAPDSLVGAASALAGSTTALAGARRMIDAWIEGQKLRSSDFYLPWLLA